MQHRNFAIGSALCILLVLCVQGTLHGQGTLNCWCMPFDSTTVVNADSVMVDTCGLSTPLSCVDMVQNETINIRVWNERRYYAKRSWRVSFEEDIIHLPSLPSDSLVYVSWQAIDTNYPAVRAGFQAIEQQYGSFRLRKVFPAAATGEYSRRFEADFVQYVNALDVMSAFNGVPLTRCYFQSEFSVNFDLPSDRALIPGTKIEDIQLAAPQTEFPPYLHRLGFQWNIYAMDLPLAWEITTGRPSIVLGAHDDWGDPCELQNFDYTHPDLTVRETLSQNGNFLRITPQYRGDAPASLMPNTALPLRGHGLRTLTCAIALGRNDNHGTPDNEQGRMIGTAFNCSGVGFYGSGKRCSEDIDDFAVEDYVSVDTDFQNNGTMQRVAVMNFSQATNDYWGIHKLLQAGTIVVAAAGNDASRQQQVPSGFVYIPDINDPTKDYYVITVGGLQDGNVFQTDCTLDNNEYQDGGEFWKGEEQFRHNYPAGLTKFSTRTDLGCV